MELERCMELTGVRLPTTALVCDPTGAVHGQSRHRSALPEPPPADLQLEAEGGGMSSCRW